jgi:hypothetical protein
MGSGGFAQGWKLLSRLCAQQQTSDRLIFTVFGIYSTLTISSVSWPSIRRPLPLLLGSKQTLSSGFAAWTLFV